LQKAENHSHPAPYRRASRDRRGIRAERGVVLRRRPDWSLDQRRPVPDQSWLAVFVTLSDAVRNPPRTAAPVESL